MRFYEIVVRSEIFLKCNLQFLNTKENEKKYAEDKSLKFKFLALSKLISEEKKN